jgi:ribosomal protein S18 acetylase RimI-like enzyme
MPLPRLPSTVRGAQRQGSLLGTFAIDDPKYGIVHFAMTKHDIRPPFLVEFGEVPLDIPEGQLSEPLRLYVLYEIGGRAYYGTGSRDQTVKPSDTLTMIGGMIISFDEDVLGEASVRLAGIDKSYRGAGIGHRMYLMAINDMVDEGYIVRSPEGRSDAAERLWRAIWRKNTDRVIATTRNEGPVPISYVEEYRVEGLLQRRPVRVRWHWRRL